MNNLHELGSMMIWGFYKIESYLEQKLINLSIEGPYCGRAALVLSLDMEWGSFWLLI